jgi:hypothetical protein
MKKTPPHQPAERGAIILKTTGAEAVGTVVVVVRVGVAAVKVQVAGVAASRP